MTIHDMQHGFVICKKKKKIIIKIYFILISKELKLCGSKIDVQLCVNLLFSSYIRSL